MCRILLIAVSMESGKLLYSSLVNIWRPGAHNPCGSKTGAGPGQGYKQLHLECLLPAVGGGTPHHGFVQG